MNASGYHVFVRFSDPPPHWNFRSDGLTKVWNVTLWAAHLAHDPRPDIVPLGEATGIGDTFEEARAQALRKLRAVMAKVAVV